MTRTRTRDRLGLMGIASAIALSAAIGWSPSAWSADKNSQQWQQQKPGQSQGSQNQNHGQPQNQGQAHNNTQPQFKNGQAQNIQPQIKNGQQPQIKNGQAQNGQGKTGQFKPQVTNQPNQPQWKPQNGQAQNGQGQNGQGQNGQAKNGQFQPQGNKQPQWKPQNGQAQNGQGQNGQGQNGQNKNGQFVQQGNQKFVPQGNNQKNVQVRTTSVTTRYDWHNYKPGQRPPEWNQHSHDVDFHTYQWNRTSQQRYHYQSYQPPHGYYYRRWTYGQVFPTVFWSQNYWLTDYYSFGLVNPPYGYVWVRYGSDALLVDVSNGQILSVEYNVFYA